MKKVFCSCSNFHRTMVIRMPIQNCVQLVHYHLLLCRNTHIHNYCAFPAWLSPTNSKSLHIELSLLPSLRWSLGGRPSPPCNEHAGHWEDSRPVTVVRTGCLSEGEMSYKAVPSSHYGDLECDHSSKSIHEAHFTELLSEVVTSQKASGKGMARNIQLSCKKTKMQVLVVNIILLNLQFLFHFHCALRKPGERTCGL